MSNPFDSGNSAPSISFSNRDEYGRYTPKPVGTKIGGRIVELPQEVQKRNFDTKKPEFWPDGNPKKTVAIGLEVEGERRSLWADRPSALFTAIKEALTDANGSVRAMEIGGYLEVELTGFKKTEGGKAPQNLYKAYYTAPNAFAGEAPAQAPASAPASTPAPASSPEDAEAARQAKLASMSPEDRALLGI